MMNQTNKTTLIQKHAESKKTRKQRDREFEAKLDKIRASKSSNPFSFDKLFDEVELHFSSTNFFGN
tara:strand:+ start:232 stop:429 length:198 start_codon:yes stop_codon:yes gene_type:complete